MRPLECMIAHAFECCWLINCLVSPVWYAWSWRQFLERDLTRTNEAFSIICSLWVILYTLFQTYIISNNKRKRDGIVSADSVLLCNIVTALGMPAIDDGELDDLTLRTGHTGKLWEPTKLLSLSSSFIFQKHLVEIRGAACLKSCPFLFQRDEGETCSTLRGLKLAVLADDDPLKALCGG
jgi:hypothetical protein